MKKFLAFIVMAVVCTLSLHSQTATAPADGNGSAVDPYQIADWENLYWISQTPASWDEHFIQTADINLGTANPAISGWDGGKGWTPIGIDIDSSFIGTYDGQGYKITGLFIDRPTEDNVGLFGHVGNSSATTVIKKLGVEGADVTGQRGTGALVGRVTGNQYTSIENCWATGSVEGTGATGGLVGSNNSYQENPGAAEGFRPRIYECWANVAVSNRTESGQKNDKIGGLAGCNQKGSISNCYARGSVSVIGGSERVGGLAGCVELRGIIINSYSTGEIIITGSVEPVGGFLGLKGSGNNEGTVSNCFYDETTSKRTDDVGRGVPKITADMKDQSTFTTTNVDWDFTTIWEIDGSTNDGYPSHRATYTPPGTWTWETNAANSNWETNTNWVGPPSTPPPDNAVVEIPANSTTHPTLNSNASVYEISIGSGSTLTIESGNTLTINKKAEGTGIIDGAGQAKFAGSVPQDVPGMTYKNLVIDNLNNARLTENISVTGNLTMTAGLLDLNGKTITLDPTATLTESATSRIYGNSGEIKTTRTLNNPSESNVGGIGVGITSSASLGSTTITRGHNQQEGGLSRKSVYRWFDITHSSTNTGLNASLVFHYNINEVPEGWDESKLELAKSTDNGTSWTHVPSIVSTGNKTVSVTGLDGFSRWTLGQESEPLPVTWLEVGAERLQDNEVSIEWSTASEINCESFEVQRSYNAADFVSIATLGGSGNTNHISNYKIIDTEAPDKTVYYRIKQNDYDGAFEYSKVMVVHGAAVGGSLKVFPNPVAGELNILLPANSGNATLIISDISGKLIYSAATSDNPHISLNTDNWSQGVYFIRFVSDKEVIVRKLIKE